MNRLLGMIAALIAVVALASCGGGNDATVSQFEADLEEAKNSEFLEEGVDLTTLTDSTEGDEVTDLTLPEGDSENTGDEDESLVDLMGDNGEPTDPSAVSQLSVIQEAATDLEEAQKQKGTDPALARVTLAHVLDQVSYVERGEEITPEVQESLSVLKADAETLRDSLDAIVRVTTPVVAADLSGKVNDPLRGIERVGDKYMLYTEGAVVTSMDPGFSTVTVTELPPDARVSAGSVFGYKGGLVLGVTPGKVIEFKDGELTYPEMTDQKWGSVQDVLTYGNRRYVYVMDPANNQIWKYPRNANSYGTPQPSLNENPQVSDGVSMAIDGNIFVLRSNGEIIRYLNGDFREDFVVKNPPSSYGRGVDSLSKLVTREELKHVYVLNHKDNSIAVYEKDTFANTKALKYVQQYVFPEEIVDLYVPSDEVELTVVTPQKLLKLPLQLPE